MRLPALLLIAWCLLFASAPAGADLWRWIDANGVVRYTPSPNSVPGAARGSLARVEPGMPALPAAAAAPSPAPTPLFAPTDEFSFAADPFNAPERAQTLRGDEISEPLDPTATTPLRADPPETPPAAAPATPTRPPTAPAASPAPTPTAEARPPVSSRPPLDGAQRQRRAALTIQIERDETTLKDLISSGETRASQPSDELREIAERLPQLQAELRELERGAAGGSDSQSP